MHTDKVDMSKLTVLKYTDEGKQKRVIRILDSANSKWKDIACLVYSKDQSGKVNTLENKHRNPTDCLREVFMEGFINNEPKEYSQNWGGLIELLDDVGFQTLSNDVKRALTCHVDTS